MAHQNGTLYEAAGTWYVRYSVASTDGQRKKVSRELGSTDLPMDEIKERRVAHMTKVNKRDKDHTGLQEDMTAIAFWAEHYLPYCEEIVVTGRARKKHSTMVGYRQIWRKHLEPHFGSTTLREYTSQQGKKFLRTLDRTLSRRSIGHVKNLASAIFSHAVEEDFISANPWRDVSIPKDAKHPENTHHYTMKEAENIISALVSRVDCQLVMALACFLGLRPGEIAALQWGDIDQNYLHIRQNIVHGVVTTPKTRGSVRDIPLDNELGERIRIPLKEWARQAWTAEGWVFDNGSGQPIDFAHLAARVIRPVVEKAGLKWKGLYAGRRGAATMLNDPHLAHLVLGNSLDTCVKFYDKGLSPAALATKLREAKLLTA